MNLKSIRKAFTLIEMLIVIVIIGILSAVLIPKVIGIQDRARKTSALHELRQIGQLMFLAQQNAGTALKNITNNSCTYCANATHDMTNKIVYLGKDSSSWISSLGKIAQAAGNTSSLVEFYTDPWGYPYLFDENEGEFYNNTNCRLDTIVSVGKDGTTTFSGTLYYYISDNPLDADNVIMDLRPLFCEGGY